MGYHVSDPKKEFLGRMFVWSFGVFRIPHLRSKALLESTALSMQASSSAAPSSGLDLAWDRA